MFYFLNKRILSATETILQKKYSKQCLRCLSVNPPGSKRCGVCRLRFGSFKESWFGRFKNFFNSEAAFAAPTKSTAPKDADFFSVQEIERITSFNKIRIPMFLILDNIKMLDERALFALGETLSAMYED